MFDSKFILGSAQAQEALALRRAVFVEELSFPEEQVFSQQDHLAAHLLVCVEGAAIASACMYPDPGGVRLAHICVAPAWRGQHFGDLCTRLLLNKAANMGTPRAIVTVPDRFAAYYQAFGFTRQACAGDPEGYVTLWVDPEQVDWHSACGGH